MKKEKKKEPEDKKIRKCMPPRQTHNEEDWEDVPTTFVSTFDYSGGTMKKPVLPEQLRDIHDTDED